MINIPLIYVDGLAANPAVAHDESTAAALRSKCAQDKNGQAFATSKSTANKGLPVSITPILDQLQHIIKQQALPIYLAPQALVAKKLTQKVKRQISNDYASPVLLIDEKLSLSLLIDGISVAPDWAGLQKRVVSAGRKSELLLQAAKLNAEHTALDATAGFGHDSLILAATGAKVTMLERAPLMALLLLFEQQKMAQLPNWQKLMARLNIVYGTAEDFLKKSNLKKSNLEKNDLNKDDLKSLTDTVSAAQFDVVYLDPMFPDNSYANSKTGKGAKVGKHMQVLHCLAKAPTLKEERQLFNLAKASVMHRGEQQQQKQQQMGRLIIKRPVNAPPLAQQTPDEQWQNEAEQHKIYTVKPHYYMLA